MSNTPRKKTLLVDGNSLFKTVFEASYTKFLKSSDEAETHKFVSNINGIYAFLMKLRIILDQGSYNNLRIAFDSSQSGSLRRDVYPDYKLKRKGKKNLMNEEQEFKESLSKRQKTKLKDYLSHFCHIYEDAVVEADDVIALYVQNKDPKEIITIVTGDVDIMQLIGDKVDVLYLNKQFKTKTHAVLKYEKLHYSQRKHLTFDSKKFKAFFGFPPENITTIKTICGDDSDEIKNIKLVRETSLFNVVPELATKVMTVEEVLVKCRELAKTELKGKNKTVVKNILEGITDGIQGKEILSINYRLVNLKSDEFITKECKDNLDEIGFLSDYKFKAIDSVGLFKKMQEDGIYKHIQGNFRSSMKTSKPLKRFFKPFLKILK